MYDIDRDGGRYTTVCKGLTAKGKDGRSKKKEQLAFLETLLERRSFVEWYESKIGSEDIKGVEVLGERLPESCFKKMPLDIEMGVFDSWKRSITPALACNGSFWSRVTYMHIKAGIIDADYLAANGGNLPSGKSRLARILKSRDAADIDKATRAALRRMGGLQVVRGRRSVYLDCSFAIAWWKGFYATEVAAQVDDVDAEDVHEMFRCGSGEAVWTQIVEPIVSKNSTFGYPEVRDAMMWRLTELPEGDVNKARIKLYYHKLSTISSNCELGIYPVAEIKELIGDGGQDATAH